MRDKNGRFLPGISGNPGGRPREVGHVRELAREHSDEAIETLVDLMRHAKPVAVSMDVVDEGQAHLDTLHEMIEQRERINREKALAEAG